MTRPRHHFLLLYALMTMLLATACRHDDVIYIPETVEIARPEFTAVQGLLVLNEGNMNMNKASLDYYSYQYGSYTRDIYSFANPRATKGLGDVGNDLGIYGSKLYAVINCSNKVEVMDKFSIERIGQINIPNCRYICFYRGYAYVTSYAGPVEINPTYTQRGYVAKIDTATLKVVATCTVGFQPDGLDVAGNRLYVANSGGYMVPNYENTLSVIDLDTFTEVNRIPLAINLHHVRADRRGVLWVTSRGDYYDTDAKLLAYDTRKQRIVADFALSALSLWFDADTLYAIGTRWSNLEAEPTLDHTYAKINTANLSMITDRFITDGTDTDIAVPYGVAVNPISGDVYVADAKDYITPGTLHCYDNTGHRLWSVRTGDIPAHFAFLGDIYEQP